MISRERILEAAGRVYAKHGFRGATTRLIANEAGVNEVTLFRTFGSKGALLQSVLEQYHGSTATPELSPAAVDTQCELTAWIKSSLARIREIRPLLIHSMGEVDERPEAAEFACRGRQIVHDIVTNFVRTLQTSGKADPEADAETAAVMLAGTIMNDAMGRSFVPAVYPPEEEAAERYAKSFARMIGLKQNAPVSVLSSEPSA